MSLTLTTPPPLAEGVVTDGLSGLSGLLAVPVHALVLVALGVLALELGRALAEGWRRVRPGAPGVRRLTLDALRHPDVAPTLSRQAPGPLAEQALLALGEAATGAPAARARRYEAALAQYELGVQRRLDRTRLLVRAGPALGLMGTLIPLAPGLAALGKGDIAQLASDMQVAFSATVLGLVVGTLAFALTLVRTRLYTEDLASFEQALDAHAEGDGEPGSGPAGEQGAPTGPAAPDPGAGVAPATDGAAGQRATGWIGRPVHHGPAVEPANGHQPGWSTTGPTAGAGR